MRGWGGGGWGGGSKEANHDEAMVNEINIEIYRISKGLNGRPGRNLGVGIPDRIPVRTSNC